MLVSSVMLLQLEKKIYAACNNIIAEVDVLWNPLLFN